MKIKKGSRLAINSQRKGRYEAIALRDFDSDVDEWYPVAVAPGNGVVYGLSNGWAEGEKIPCRRSLCRSIKAIEGES